MQSIKSILAPLLCSALPAVAQLAAVLTVGSESEVAALAFVIVLAEEWNMG